MGPSGSFFTVSTKHRNKWLHEKFNVIKEWVRYDIMWVVEKVCRNETSKKLELVNSKNLLILFSYSWLIWFSGIIMRPYTICLVKMQWCAIVNMIIKSLLPLMVQKFFNSFNYSCLLKKHLLHRYNFFLHKCTNNI